VVVRGKNHMEVVRHGSPADIGFKHIGSVSMKRSPARKPFISMAQDVNENRFTLPDNYDRSSYLTTTSRIKALVPFEG